jgi:hypothetical protein
MLGGSLKWKFLNVRISACNHAAILMPSDFAAGLSVVQIADFHHSGARLACEIHESARMALIGLAWAACTPQPAGAMACLERMVIDKSGHKTTIPVRPAMLVGVVATRGIGNV